MAEVRLQDVYKSFRDTEVVKSITLTVKDREFLTLVGPSGCGKSTTLNLVAGLETLTRGDIFFDNWRVTGVPPERREAAMVFQSYALYPHKTVFENIAFPLRIRGLPEDEVARKVRQVADTLNLATLIDRRPVALSGGQRQRVALGRALVRPAKVFLLDEPLSNLDAQLRVHMRAELKKLHSDVRMTMIYVTHDQAEAMTLSDRVAILHQGALQQVDTPRSVYNHPANKFVAGFIGSPAMNFLETGLASTGDGVAVRLGRYLHPVPKALSVAAHDALGPEARVIVGVRPEHVEVTAAEQPNSLPAQVYVIEPMGHLCYVEVLCEGHRLMGTAAADFDAAEGTTVFIRLDPERIHLFDPATEKAVR